MRRRPPERPPPPATCRAARRCSRTRHLLQRLFISTAPGPEPAADVAMSSAPLSCLQRTGEAPLLPPAPRPATRPLFGARPLSARRFRHTAASPSAQELPPAAAAAAAAAEAAPAAVSGAPAAGSSSRASSVRGAALKTDLQGIKGVGPQYERLLVIKGLTSVSKLQEQLHVTCAGSTERLQKFLQVRVGAGRGVCWLRSLVPRHQRRKAGRLTELWSPASPASPLGAGLQHLWCPSFHPRQEEVGIRNSKHCGWVAAHIESLEWAPPAPKVTLAVEGNIGAGKSTFLRMLSSPSMRSALAGAAGGEGLLELRDVVEVSACLQSLFCMPSLCPGAGARCSVSAAGAGLGSGALAVGCTARLLRAGQQRCGLAWHWRLWAVVCVRL